MIVFHGTTRALWRKKVRGKGSLYVTTDAASALEFGYHAAESEDDDAGPLLVAAELNEIVTVRGVELLPDEACLVSNRLDEGTWADTARLCGMFQIYGPIETKVKPLFRAVRGRS
jgi:hypothetical protein